jgi:protein-tyrosine-phosphatase
VWEQVTGQQGTSAGTHPAPAVHPGAVVAAGRADLDLTWARPRALRDVHVLPPLVITVCDRAHEELEPTDGWLHWSIPDPVPVGTAEAFDAAVDELRARARALASLAAAA